MYCKDILLLIAVCVVSCSVIFYFYPESKTLDERIDPNGAIVWDFNDVTLSMDDNEALDLWNCDCCDGQFSSWEAQQRHMLYFCSVLHPLTDTEKQIEALEQRVKVLEERPYIRITDSNDIYESGWVFNMLPNNKCLIIEEGENE